MSDEEKLELAKQSLEYVHGILLDILNGNVDKDEVINGVTVLELLRGLK